MTTNSIKPIHVYSAHLSGNDFWFADNSDQNLHSEFECKDNGRLKLVERVGYSQCGEAWASVEVTNLSGDVIISERESNGGGCWQSSRNEVQSYSRSTEKLLKLLRGYL